MSNYQICKHIKYYYFLVQTCLYSSYSVLHKIHLEQLETNSRDSKSSICTIGDSKNNMGCIDMLIKFVP